MSFYGQHQHNCLSCYIHCILGHFVYAFVKRNCNTRISFIFQGINDPTGQVKTGLGEQERYNNVPNSLHLASIDWMKRNAFSCPFLIYMFH